jgi:hypothetical protein
MARQPQSDDQSREFEKQLLQTLQQISAQTRNVDLEAMSLRVRKEGADLALNSAGTAGTYGSLSGCFGTLGSFGSLSATDIDTTA